MLQWHTTPHLLGTTDLMTGNHFCVCMQVRVFAAYSFVQPSNFFFFFVHNITERGAILCHSFGMLALFSPILFQLAFCCSVTLCVTAAYKKKKRDKGRM